ncbi:MAG TPA: DUF932 domain-containing protein [Candidatus Paceibacterota bacterium]
MHEIEVFRDGTGSFVSARKNAWHLLGKVKPDGYLSLEEMLRESRADYLVEKYPIFSAIIDDNGKLIDTVENPDWMHTIRRHPETGEYQILGVVGKNYTVVQNSEAFAFGQALLDTHEAIGETAGVLHSGKRAFCCFRLPDEIMVGGTDRVVSYLVIYTSHDGSVSLHVMLTNIRVVCQNTVNLALSEAHTTYKLRHTRYATLDLEEVRAVLELSKSGNILWKDEAEQLLDIRVSDARFEEIITREFGPDRDAPQSTITAWQNKRNLLMDLFTSSPTLDKIRHTGWGAYNAIAEYQDWFLPVRRAGENGVNNDLANAAKFTRSITGANKVNTPKLQMYRALTSPVSSRTSKLISV